MTLHNNEDHSVITKSGIVIPASNETCAHLIEMAYKSMFLTSMENISREDTFRENGRVDIDDHEPTFEDIKQLERRAIANERAVLIQESENGSLCKTDIMKQKITSVIVEMREDTKGFQERLEFLEEQYDLENIQEMVPDSKTEQAQTPELSMA